MPGAAPLAGQVPNELPGGADPLAGLRPYELPEPIPWWPPAPGWWLLLALALGLLAAVLWLRRRAHRRRTPVALASRELAALACAWRADGDTSAYLGGLSALLRRFALARFSAAGVAGLCGPRWLEFLATHDDGDGFRNGPGRRLLDAPYRLTSDADAAAIAALITHWIARNGAGTGSAASQRRPRRQWRWGLGLRRARSAALAASTPP